ncbi:hypothetical protein EPI10_006047 [Gossypium australe]|uniref:Uncharacterized protein n=1 Tax=Gossypium australe TaxID=47621 RepID=A0A5B6WRJ6_9ROSI|nr:hypothetical protein EPI10_006047 [Gossypium australe]
MMSPDGALLSLFGTETQRAPDSNPKSSSQASISTKEMRVRMAPFAKVQRSYEGGRGGTELLRRWRLACGAAAQKFQKAPLGFLFAELV